MNEQTVKGKWKEIKGEIQTMWGELTADDLDKTEGNLSSIVGIIQQKYGHRQQDVSQKLNEIVARYQNEAADVSNQFKQSLRKDKSPNAESKI